MPEVAETSPACLTPQIVATLNRAGALDHNRLGHCPIALSVNPQPVSAGGQPTVNRRQPNPGPSRYSIPRGLERTLRGANSWTLSFGCPPFLTDGRRAGGTGVTERSGADRDALGDLEIGGAAPV